MWLYLVKFSACLAVLLLFYKLVLEPMHLHHFKRYYLLSAFIIALGIPLITFTQYVTITLEPNLTVPYLDQASSNIKYNEASAVNLLPSILWSIYALGVALFFFKFSSNLKSLIKNIRNNPKLRSGRIHHVLLQELIAPHTFFNYIFFNRKQYNDQKIPQEIFWHEETHAKQKHSLDILFLELLQILFWFHPCVHWAKHMVKLNHEFLADQSVITKGAAPVHYQNMVLAFSSNAVAPSLANSIHYSSIKKRIVIMKTQTSKKSVLIRTILLLPLLALLIYGFSEKTQLKIYSNTNETITSNDSSYTIMGPSSQVDQTLTKRENWQPTENDFKIWKENEGNFLFYIHGKPVISKALNQYEPDYFYHFAMKSVPLADRTKEYPQPYTLRLYTQEEFENIPKPEFGMIYVKIQKNGQLLVNDQLCSIENLADRLQKLQADFDKNEKKGRFMSLSPDKSTSRTTKDKVREIMRNAQLSGGTLKMDQVVHPVNSDENVHSQEGATKDEIQEFNTLAKIYNAQPQEKRVVPLSDLQKLERIYGRMTESQKEMAQPFPHCPPPPPAPVSPHKKIKENHASPPPMAPKDLKGGTNNTPTPPILDPASLTATSQTIPPPPPPYAVPNKEKHSKVLVEAFEKFDKKANSYSKATNAFINNGNGTVSNLQELYDETMVLYNHYVELAIKEDLMKRTPSTSSTKKEKGKIEPKKVNLEEIENNTQDHNKKVDLPSQTLDSGFNHKQKSIKEPSVYYGQLYAGPQLPPQPHPNPVKFIQELAEKGATFYIGPHQYKTTEAIELVRKSEDPSIDVSDYPIVRLGGC